MVVFPLEIVRGIERSAIVPVPGTWTVRFADCKIGRQCSIASKVRPRSLIWKVPAFDHLLSGRIKQEIVELRRSLIIGVMLAVTPADAFGQTGWGRIFKSTSVAKFREGDWDLFWNSLLRAADGGPGG